MTMTMSIGDLDLSPEPTTVAFCPDCGKQSKYTYRQTPEALRFPHDYMRFNALDALLTRRPWLEDIRLGALPVALRDSVVSSV